MIIKEKVVHFYKWQVSDQTIQVIGLQGTKGGGINFEFYIDKDKIEDEDGEMAKKFVKELAQKK